MPKQRSREHRAAIAEAVTKSFSVAGALRYLGRRVAGGNYKTLYAHIERYKLDTSHWTGKGYLRGKSHDWAPSMPIERILIEKSPYRGGTFKLKMRLLGQNLLHPACQRCGITAWCGQSLKLHLDHINGVATDNRLHNLRLLCPNCHSQTETYCGKNKQRRRPTLRRATVQAISK